MITDPRGLFVIVEDRWNWDKYIDQCDKLALDETYRHRAKASYQYLRGVLGEGYLKRAERQGNPMFYWYFSDSSARARMSMIRFAEALKALDGAPNYDAFLRRIKRPNNFEEFAESRSVIEVAHKLARAGFAIEFEPKVKVRNHLGMLGPKKPDMMIINNATGEEIIVEVSRLRASAHQNLIGRTYDAVWEVLVHDGMHRDPEALKDVLHPRHILPYALIYRGIEDDDLKVILNEIRSLIEVVRSSGRFGELIIPGTIEVGIASYDDHTRVLEWAAARGIREADLVKGPDILADEVARAKVKLRQELKQLPDEMPGIVVIPTTENLIFFVFDVEWITAAMAEEVEKNPKLLCAVLFHTFDSSGDEPLLVNIGDHTFSRQVRSDGATEQSLIIRNPVCNQPTSNHTMGLINTAFVTGW